MIKSIVLITLLLASLNASSQTDIIAARSHASSINQLTENDNFGIPSRSIDSIIYIGNGCIVEDADWYGRDTICDHPLFVENEFDEEKLKELYPDHVVFKGFSKSEKKKADSQNSVSWFIALLGLSYLFYLVFPRLLSKKNS
ncbi:MAG: hypothetical protein ACI865_000138 [Flavobacteriaceae bacterium]|jgi:hypothetical protein